MTKRRIDVNPLNALPAIIMLVVVLIALYYIASGVFWVVAKLAWGLLAGALFINHKVVLNYVTMLFNLLKKNPLGGILGIGLTVFLYPVVFLFLFAKALLYRKIDTLKKEFETRQGGVTEEEYAEYEEVEIPKEEKPLELPRRPLQEKQNEYEELFDDDV